VVCVAWMGTLPMPSQWTKRCLRRDDHSGVSTSEEGCCRSRTSGAEVLHQLTRTVASFMLTSCASGGFPEQEFAGLLGGQDAHPYGRLHQRRAACRRVDHLQQPPTPVRHARQLIHEPVTGKGSTTDSDRRITRDAHALYASCRSSFKAGAAVAGQRDSMRAEFMPA